MAEKKVPVLQNIMVVVAGLCGLAMAGILYSKKADYFFIAAGSGVMFLFVMAVTKVLFAVLQEELNRKHADDTLALLKKRQHERDKQKGDGLNVEG